LNLGDNNPLTSYTLDNSKIAKKDYNPVTMYGGRVTVLWEPTGWQITPQLAAPATPMAISVMTRAWAIFRCMTMT
jgi:hypothetical protein